jgi:hypothetical protein
MEPHDSKGRAKNQENVQNPGWMELEGWDFSGAAYIARLCQFQLISLPRQHGRGWQYPQLGLPSASA